MKSLIWIGLFLGLVGCSSTSRMPKSPSDRFAEFVDSYFSGAYNLQPKPDSLHPFPSLQVEADSLDARSAQTALRDLRAIDTVGISVDERIDWLQLEAAMKRRIRDSMLHPSAKNASQYLTLGRLYWLLLGDRPLSGKQWQSVLETVRQAPMAMELGMRQLHRPPPLWVSLAANTAKRYVDFLDGMFAEKVRGIAPDSIRALLLEDGKKASHALRTFGDFLQTKLEPGDENSWMAGAEYYDWLLKESHFLPYSSAEMVEIGRKIHRETKTDLESLARRMNPSKSWQELVEEMKMHHPEPGTITGAYKRESDRVRNLLVSKGLVAIPEPETLLFVPTPPALRETYAWGGYGGIEVIDSIPSGRFFVTDVVPEMTPDEIEEKLRAQNEGWVTIIALHEGYPGHHLQSLYARKNSSKVRSRFGNTYYGEGWALYCEAWMARSGFYENAYDSLAWLQMRLWRTARVIVDPSLHTGRMTYEQAVRFMVEEVGLERSAAEAEVNRYTTWPTQAPSYIVGWLELEKLETELRDELGKDFREREFLESVLQAGPLPLELMKRAVQNHYFRE